MNEFIDISKGLSREDLLKHIEAAKIVAENLGGETFKIHVEIKVMK